MNSTIEKLEKKVNLRYIFFSVFAVTMFQVVFSLYIQPELMRYTKENVLDVRFFYTAEDILKLLKSLGDEGIEIYYYHLVLDMFYPFAYTSAFFLLIAYLSRKGKFKKNFYRIAYIFPLSLFFTDIFENTVNLINLKTFPNATFFYDMAGYFTAVKFILLFLAILSVSMIGLFSLRALFSGSR